MSHVFRSSATEKKTWFLGCPAVAALIGQSRLGHTQNAAKSWAKELGPAAAGAMDQWMAILLAPEMDKKKMEPDDVLCVWVST